MSFSRRTRAVADHAPNALGSAVARRRAEGGLYDLTLSNPTAAGLPYDAEAIARALGTPRALVYEPDPLGLGFAREVVAREYIASGIDLSASCVAITASTSEAYAVLFKMLCDPGDEILVPVPSYPLLGWLASFEGVTLRTYPLEYAGRWYVDLAALARMVTPRTRAIVVVAPNNPTGSYLGRDELEAMLDLSLPIISDEVFARYPLAALPDDRVESVLRAKRGLVFALSGLSKLVGLPQMKLGWIACGGDERRASEAIAGLEVVLDAYLSVGTPVQHALPDLLRAGALTADAIRNRTRTNLAHVRAAAAARASTMTVLDVEGGWYATLRVPETRSDEEWALRLVEEDGVYVHPGYFFDMPRGAHLVVSLLTPERDLREGMTRIAKRVAQDV
jgi:alanine-synthesizing transaminase